MSDITVQEANGRLQQAQFVDVREDSEVAQGRIPGALHIPLRQLSVRMGEIDLEQPVVAVCRSGNRSSRATELLNSAGYDCDNMAGGMLAWQAAGLPTVR